ncbi:hypothetical protein CTAYLR_006801 [Chrysophaeum taylorii]|uniref:Cation-transporting P-type ATPase N-terminal domain-containing protein n=1 Tax=Chrysophaeum taylorii TaxID=2483200 RepID=A0AAD7XI59_9STRA|nr:hypothetical protein CTAYLR_006801 [Chrysophaeum taylorii]
MVRKSFNVETGQPSDSKGEDTANPITDVEVGVAGMGLSSAEAAARLERFGRNEVPIEKVPLWKVFVRQFNGTMPAMLILACLLAAAVQDWEDFGIILFMVLLNACIGYYEETKAMASLDALRDELIQEVSVMRDGRVSAVDVAELVPGDLVALRGGQAVPADALWYEGDAVKVDTAALTGEPIPWTVPRNREAETKEDVEILYGVPNTIGRRMLSGCLVVQGECMCIVTATGTQTEIGQAAAMVAETKAGPRQMSLFEAKIMAVVKMLIVCSLCVTGVVFFVQLLVRHEPFAHVLLVSLSLVIGAVPIALPLVLQVTMALGAREMAHHGAIVTHTTALQEIASMTVLNSDKTGTLTTAKMSIIPDMIWLAADDDVLGEAKPRLTKEDCLTLCALASNPSNLEDPIDAAVFRAFHAKFARPGEQDPEHENHAAGGGARVELYGQREKFDGFNPDVKRAVTRYRRQASNNQPVVRIAKGLLDKILDTGDDTGIEQWVCAGVDRESKTMDQKVATLASTDVTSGAVEVKEGSTAADAARDAAKGRGGGVRARAFAADAVLSAAGYKTIAVCAAFYNDTETKEGEMRLVGLVPMLDPPRVDTSATIQAINRAGISVKMITGDHVNIARETARLIGLGDQILHQSELWPASAVRTSSCSERAPHRVTQVMPMDKREVVVVLQNRGLVVGMTGDGVNDAAALAQAQVGIAVEGATDAATNAADIVLTRPGLSAIYAGVYEARLIFRRLRAYVLYRVAATIQIVLVLCALIFGWNDELPPIYVILLALFNDVTMTPIAHDTVEPSPNPEIPETLSLLVGSTGLGVLQSIASVVFYIVGGWVTGIDGWTNNDHYKKRMACVYLQISISVELLIFLCRAPKPVLLTKPPSRNLFLSVMLGNIISTLLCAFHIIVATNLSWRAIAGIWIFDIAAFFAVDLVKVMLLWAGNSLEFQSRALDDPSVITRAVAEAAATSVSTRVSDPTGDFRPSIASTRFSTRPTANFAHVAPAENACQSRGRMF